MAKPNLRVVASNPEPSAPVIDEPDLRHLFRAEAEVERVLAKIREMLALERRAFAERHGLLVAPRMELLRTRYAPPRKGIGTSAGLGPRRNA